MALDADRPLRVALYTPAWPDGGFPNGIVTYASHMVPALRKTGVEVFVVTGSMPRACADPRVSMPVPEREPAARRVLGRLAERLYPGSAAQRDWARAIVRVIQRLEREDGIDLVEMEESFGWCGKISADCSVPVIARLHGPWFLNGAMVADTRTRAFARRVRVEGRALREVAAITAPSADVLQRTLAKYGSGLAESRVIHNPVPAAAADRRWSPGGCEPKTVLFVGRFDRHKGGDTIIEAFGKLRRTEPGARLVFVGPDKGLVDDAGDSWTLERYLDRHLPAGEDRAAVECLGTQPPAAIEKLRCRAAVTVVPSRYEIFGYTLGEAMAQACPIVATRTGGFPELVRDGQEALLAPPGDPTGLAAAIARLLADPALAARLGAAAAERHARHLDPGSIARQTSELYREVVARAARKRA